MGHDEAASLRVNAGHRSLLPPSTTINRQRPSHALGPSAWIS
jgi:hypothetical protein